MNIESIRDRLVQAKEQRQRAGTNCLADVGVTAVGLYFGDLFTIMGRSQPETNTFAVAAVTVSVVAAGAALYRARQALNATNQRGRLWKEQDHLLRNRPSSLQINPC